MFTEKQDKNIEKENQFGLCEHWFECCKFASSDLFMNS